MTVRRAPADVGRLAPSVAWEDGYVVGREDMYESLRVAGWLRDPEGANPRVNESALTRDEDGARRFLAIVQAAQDETQINAIGQLYDAMVEARRKKGDR